VLSILPQVFALSYAGLTVDLLVPPGFEAPRRVEPAGATWSASQSLLRWQLGAAAVPPGAAGSLVAAFRVKEGSEAAAAGIAACRAMLALRGEGGLATHRWRYM
jgi:hypothetical protein